MKRIMIVSASLVAAGILPVVTPTASADVKAGPGKVTCERHIGTGPLLRESRLSGADIPKRGGSLELRQDTSKERRYCLVVRIKPSLVGSRWAKSLTMSVEPQSGSASGVGTDEPSRTERLVFHWNQKIALTVGAKLRDGQGRSTYGAKYFLIH